MLFVTSPLKMTVSQPNSLTEERDEMKRIYLGKYDDDNLPVVSARVVAALLLHPLV